MRGALEANGVHIPVSDGSIPSPAIGSIGEIVSWQIVNL